MTVAESASQQNLDALLDRSNLTGRQYLIYSGQRLSPGVGLYDAAYLVHLPELDPQRLRTAWHMVRDACDALRIVIEEIDGVPQQRTSRDHADFEFIDLSPGDTPAEWITRRMRSPSGTGRAPVDGAVLRNDEGSHWFLSVSGAVADDEAARKIIAAVFDAYQRPGTLRDMPSFLDYAAEVSLERRRPAYAAARSYWRAALAEWPHPPDFYGTAARGTRQLRARLTLKPAPSDAIVALAGRAAEGGPPTLNLPNTFATLFAAYLLRVGRAERIALGITAPCRDTPREQAMVGPLMEIVPVLYDFDDDESLEHCICRMNGISCEALAQRLYSVPNPPHQPVYDALFDFVERPEHSGFPARIEQVHTGHGAHAIALSVTASPDRRRFELCLDLNAAIAARVPAAQALAHLVNLLETAVATPSAPLSRHGLVDVAGAATIVRGGTGAASVLPRHGCLDDFTRCALARPAAVAVSADGHRLTYEQLHSRVLALAQQLHAIGAGAGSRVGICLDRSPDMVIAMLAALKSGATYVPLDPGYPRERLQFMLRDASPAVVLTTDALAARLGLFGATGLPREQWPSTVRGRFAGAPIKPDDAAYLMYTSGSTGTPKGVLVTHRGVVNYLRWRSSYFPLTQSDRVLQKASLSFDDSVWEILEPLSVGATVVLARPQFEYDGAYLVRLIAEERISAACFVPTMLSAIIDEPLISTCTALRRLTTGGEILDSGLVQRVQRALPGVDLYNGYGATETTIASTFWHCAADPRRHPVPIGRPIANTQVYVLDSAGNLCPDWVTGEICIAGDGVAAGYWNRPELTAERFVTADIGGRRVRVYRTGDLGRFASDGNLEFAGRIDTQVKVRGVRVELGEIESVLLDHAEVSAAAVIDVLQSDGGRCLVAFVAARPRAHLDVALRDLLRARLPSAMLPNRVVRLDALPVLPSGKLDRGTLANLCSQSAVVDEYEPPHGPLETQLVEIWKDVLQARPIGRHDDFFQLGGHSLLAVRVASALERHIGRPLPPGLLFEASTVARLARRIEQGDESTHGCIVPFAEGDGLALFFVHQVDGDVVRYGELARMLGAEFATFGIRAVGMESDEEPLHGIVAMAARYVDELRAIRPRGPYALVGHSAGGLIALEMARMLAGRGEPVALLGLLDTDADLRRQRSLADAFRYHVESAAGLSAGARLGYVRRHATAWLASLFGRVRRAFGISPAAATPSFNIVRRAIEDSVMHYVPRPYSGDAIIFRACDRRVTGTYSPSLGWRKLIGTLTVIDVPGDHLSMLRSDLLGPLSTQLRQRLNAAGTRAPVSGQLATSTSS